MSDVTASPQPDPTKSNSYAWLDLGTKIVSALALVALGVSGALFQSQTSNSQKAIEQREREERKYLPMLRSLIEFDIALEGAIEILGKPDSRGNLKTRDRVGSQLRYSAFGLFMPDVDPLVEVRLPESSSEDVGIKRRKMPLRATALMLAELIRAQSFFGRRQYDKNVDENTIAISANGLEVGAGEEQSVFYIGPDSVPSWQAWLGAEPQPLSKVTGAPFMWLANDLRFRIAEVVQSTLHTHPDVAEKYVSIRNDVLKQAAIFRPAEPDRQSDKKEEANGTPAGPSKSPSIETAVK